MLDLVGNLEVRFSCDSALLCFVRDMFVEDEMKPINRIISESNLEFIFNLDDESMLVSVYTVALYVQQFTFTLIFIFRFKFHFL